MRRVIREWIPPAVLRILRSTGRQEYGYSGNYESWEAAGRASSGYDSDLILNKVKDALLKVKHGKRVYERDSVLFDEIQYAWPLLAALLWVASQNRNHLNLVDFGGSLGSSYFQNRGLLEYVDEIRWSIVEQSSFVECGKRYFQDDNLRFYHTLDECMEEQRPNAILLSSVLPYLEKPYLLVSQIVEKGFDVILIDRTPLLLDSDDRLTVQKVPPEIYEGSYPAWILNRDKLLAAFNLKYELIAEFDGLAGTIAIDSAQAKDKGFLLRKR